MKKVYQRIMDPKRGDCFKCAKMNVKLESFEKGGGE